MLIVFVAGLLNGSFTLPMKYSRSWFWENLWSVYSALAFLVVPWGLAIGFVPHLAQVYGGLDWRALFYPALFGLLWGVAQTTFGLAVKAVGMAVAFAVVSGLVCVIGAIVPLLIFNPADLFRPVGLMMLASMPVFLTGLVLYGRAGTRRDTELGKTGNGAMNFKVGFALCIFTGILGCAWNIGFALSGDILHRSTGLGASALTATYAAWAIVLFGSFFPNFLYPLYLLVRQHTWTAFRSENWFKELALGVAMAALWVSAIVAYGIGATLVGIYGTSVGFTLYIAATILASSAFGIFTGEWKGTSSRTRRLLGTGIAAVVISVAILNSGRLLASSQQPRGKTIASFEWTGPQIAYPPPASPEEKKIVGPSNKYWGKLEPQVHGDSFPMTWADDDEIYTSAGDPVWGEKNDGLDFEKFSGAPPDYHITRVNPMFDFTGSGGDGQKPTGMISVKGVLYLAYQNLLGGKPPLYGTKSQHADDAVIAASYDHGQTWVQTPKTVKTPMFPGPSFGGPAFINFGRDNENAVDQYVYAISGDQWDNGTNLRLGRVPADKILDATAWEWVSSVNSDYGARWTKQLAESKPVFSRERSLSAPDMVYIAAIKQYVVLSWKLKQDFSPVDGSELFIYASPQPWGPFTLIHHEDLWESKDMTPYCPKLPLKWLKASGDEITGWLQFSGSWREESPHYRSHVRPFRIRLD